MGDKMNKKLVLLTTIVMLLLVSVTIVIATPKQKSNCELYGDFIDNKQHDLKLVSYEGTFCNFELEQCRNSFTEEFDKYTVVCIDPVELRVYEITNKAMSMLYIKQQK